jgi:hypothetical protein
MERAAGTHVPAALLVWGARLATLNPAHEAAKSNEARDHGAAHQDNRYEQLIHAETTFIL